MQRMPVTPVRKLSENESSHEDLLVTEEPLEIRIGYGQVDNRKEMRLAVTMRTPGDDHQLAVGFLFSEGLINGMTDVLRVEHCQQVKDEEQGNVVRVELKPEIILEPDKWQRNFYMTSSCGVCGKSSLDAVSVICDEVKPFEGIIDKELLTVLPDQMRKAQVIFEHTGGIHAAALFNSTGELLLVHEDIGRHNAVDKVIGSMSQNNVTSENTIMVVSGRAGFELVQKAAVAGIPVMLSVGAPSSLAVQLAEDRGIILYGFVSNGKANRYTKLD